MIIGTIDSQEAVGSTLTCHNYSIKAMGKIAYDNGGKVVVNIDFDTRLRSSAAATSSDAL